MMTGTRNFIPVKWIAVAATALFWTGALASVPKKLNSKAVRTDAVIVQEVSEIRVSPRKELNFDQDIERLAKVEKRYKERLPMLDKRARLNSPANRIQSQRYTPTVTN